MSATRASNWFATEQEFRQLCGDAVSEAKTEAQQEFANKMVMAAKEYGLKTYISDRQLKFLCTIAGQHVPEALPPPAQRPR
jgi:hypothetical protein